LTDVCVIIVMAVVSAHWLMLEQMS